MTVKDIRDQFVPIKWGTLFTVLSSAVSILIAVFMTYNAIMGEIKETKTELKAQLDTVKVNQLRQYYENRLQQQRNDTRFQRIEDKLDAKQ